MLRTYRPSDFDACAEIVGNVWDFDGRFTPPAVAALFKKAYAGLSLSYSNFAMVSEEGGRVEGFLFGNCGQDNLIPNEFGGLAGKARFAWCLLLASRGDAAKVVRFLRMATEHDRNRLALDVSRQSEVNLFCMNPARQGRGQGKALMRAFVDHCRAKGARQITLDTERETSNYGFYDHYGFRPVGEFFSPLQQEFTAGSGESFTYALDITDNSAATTRVGAFKPPSPAG